MDTNEDQELMEQRRRRNRINRMKTCIIYGIVFWMVASMAAIVVLSIRVAHLHHELDRLSERQSAVETAVTKVQGNTQTETDDAGMTDEVMESGINSSDNIAGEGDVHKVYLTFDGSPDANTDKILDVLKQYGVKASFFVSGDTSEEMKPVYKRIVQEGHTLGMHSFSNRYREVYASKEAFTEDFDRLSDYLEQVTGTECRFYRFPGGSCNEISNVPMTEFVQILNEKDVTYFDWNVSAGDTGSSYSVEDVVDNVTSGVTCYKTSVVLLHDGEDKSTTVEALGSLIEALQEMKVQILPIDEHTKTIQYIRADSVEEK